MMSRPMLLVFLLLILIITSQFEWRQPLVNDIDTKPAVNPKQLQISKWEEGVKEKVRSVVFHYVFFIHLLGWFVNEIICGCNC
ncbi:hypothetical protein POPTR_004G200200v4 [Populus trichocarpa]|jgi:hypothetical protein|uniref:Uncharacterized protein n=1 Tax=Populus trichocarpa TaxID=3694 RepID=A0ACC0T5U3_POPTR|nr:hypothetical protein BDE02_04G171000 [Populus trichocarpa]KAI9396875.1 hypothetical protein POPTR_004G200200v4 [Populus trichocarpa]